MKKENQAGGVFFASYSLQNALPGPAHKKAAACCFYHVSGSFLFALSVAEVSIFYPAVNFS
ncbi:MAG: hypothetical protein LUD07_04790 [Clostridiales bacterium]|nr:hypothetical protein [Clostridiales bacterium]